jgi:hypothetical protein
MAADMKRVAAGFTPKASPNSLPLVANPRLALDVASADNLPLVVAVGKDAATRQRIVDRLAKLAWSDDLIGWFTYAEGTIKDVIGVPGITIEAGVVVIAPDKFGQKGNVLHQVGAEEPADKIAAALKATTTEFKAQAKSFQNHVREGHRLGVFWDTKVPVTDPMENAARERGKRAGPAKE